MTQSISQAPWVQAPQPADDPPITPTGEIHDTRISFVSNMPNSDANYPPSNNRIAIVMFWSGCQLASHKVSFAERTVNLSE